MKNKNLKKYQKRRTTFFLIGLNIALASVLYVFNWGITIEATALRITEPGVGVLFSDPIPPLRIEEPQKQLKEPLSKSSEIEIGEEDPNKEPNEPVADPVLGKGLVAQVTAGDAIEDDSIEIFMPVDKTIYNDVQPIFKGKSVQEYVKARINIPSIVEQLGLTGIIRVQFVIEKDGSISNLRIANPKSRYIGYGAEEACLKVLRLTSGYWKPAVKNNQPVRSFVAMPIELDYSNTGFR